MHAQEKMQPSSRPPEFDTNGFEIEEDLAILSCHAKVSMNASRAMSEEQRERSSDSHTSSQVPGPD